MMKLRFTLDDEERFVSLTGAEVRIGRSGDNEVILPDYSVSRRHAIIRDEGEQWCIYDLKSTNGVQVNQADVERKPLRPGDLLKIGIFELRIEGHDEVPTHRLERGSAPGLPADPSASPVPGPPPVPGVPPVPGAPSSPAAASGESVISNATIVRSLKEFTADYGFDESHDSTDVREEKRRALDEAYGTRIFVYLTRLGQTLITTDSVDVVMERVMEIAFDALPVDRGFMLLRDEASGELECELMRLRDRMEHRPQGDVPISKTMLESVMRERVALLTYDALSDQRLAGTESVRIHQIRAAMCTPLWSGEKIIGVMQVDTPHHAGSFTEPDVDLLTTLANFCAVAIERIRNARRVDYERQLRSRLERYHSPGVIEEVMQEEEGETRTLKKVEASVLFADLVGFTAFSENSTPEDVAELMESYFTYAVESIFSAGGTLDKFIGDCVMAFFGAPMAQADHAERAVTAAISIQESLDKWNAERRADGLPPIRNRIGINSGPVVVGDIGSNRRVDYTVLGNTVNVAARLEGSVAGPGEIVIGEATQKLVKDKFPVESLGETQLKGLSQRIAAYRVLRD